MDISKLDTPLRRIVEATHHDPFEALGRHVGRERVTVRAFLPRAEQAHIVGPELPLERIPGTDLFEWSGPVEQVPERYQIAWSDHFGHAATHYDPYCFPPQIDDFDLHLFGQGTHWHAYRFLGAHPRRIDGIDG
ncbi:MAG: hypothetical protein B0D82_02730, partial [Candidatus Sedimenticola endophacoides]